MTALDLIALLLTGAVAGVMSGMFGIGGGAIIVPALMLLLGYSQVKANGTSLAALLLPVAIFACWQYYKQGKLIPRVALLVAVGLAGGAYFGANIALGLDPALLKRAFGAFLLYMAWRYAMPRQWWREWRGETPSPPAKDEELAPNFYTLPMMLFLILTGFLAGILSGLFGIGGGIIIITVLTVLLGFDQKLANGTSLGALLLPVGLPAVYEYHRQGQLDLAAAVPLAAMLALFSIAGARFALGLPAAKVKRYYGVFLLFIGVRFLLFP
ncbi:sulfite exporter TauE/SafE family protein [bacterium]|nr:sulfite exporter TauE/SafE family protein [bacterium]